MRFVTTNKEILTIQLQDEELNILNALKLVEASVKSLERTRSNDNTMNASLDAINHFAITIGINSATEFNRKYRSRLKSGRTDENPERQLHTPYTFHSFCRICETIDSLIIDCSENIKVTVQKKF